MKTQFKLIQKNKSVARELDITIKGDKHFLEELKRRIESIAEYENIKIV